MRADVMPTRTGRGAVGPGATPLAGADEVELRLRRLDKVATLMDSRFRLPGGFRVGIDPLLGLVPGIGDGISAVVSLYTVLEARRLGASGGTLARMLLNIGLDFAGGSIPLLGDVFDATFKSNLRNLALLRRHLGRPGG